ncbi:DUF6193 family natural product biosynthesis protein [Kitasatospora sp. NPDC056138]|uniref:DUF6193 family natural product biosynthesis protein n=1 Tax=Kitasatospora sp. NPDC056138 TaxID=3345724 RepID=UPI0035DA115D
MVDWKKFVEIREAELAAARERGPAYVVDLQWRRLREQALEADYPEFLALVDSAAREPRLRRLFPFTSMWVLCFSFRADDPSLAEAPAVIARQGGRYEVRAGRWGESIGETDSADQAVALVVANLPADLDAAVTPKDGEETAVNLR